MHDIANIFRVRPNAAARKKKPWRKRDYPSVTACRSIYAENADTNRFVISRGRVIAPPMMTVS